MIRLEVIKEGHFVLRADEPVTVEVVEDESLVAHVYRGAEVEDDAEPIGMYDGWLNGYEGNKTWESKGDADATLIVLLNRRIEEADADDDYPLGHALMDVIQMLKSGESE